MIRREVTIGECRLILGDCLDVVPGLDCVDHRPKVRILAFEVRIVGGFGRAFDFAESQSHRAVQGFSLTHFAFSFNSRAIQAGTVLPSTITVAGRMVPRPNGRKRRS